MADMDTTKGQLVTMLFNIGQIRKDMEDNLVSQLQADYTAFQTIVDNLGTLISALTQSPGSDCQSLP